MPEHDQVAVVARVRAADSTRAVGGRVDRLALFGGDVEALVKRRLARERIRAAAERACQPAVGRPDRRRRRRERFLPLDVAPDVAQPALEALQERRSTPKVSSGEMSDVDSTLEIAALGWRAAARGPRLYDAGSCCIARACAGSSAARAPRSSMTFSSD